MRDLRLAVPIYLLSILILIAPAAPAQMVGGTISGDVVDPQGPLSAGPKS